MYHKTNNHYINWTWFYLWHLQIRIQVIRVLPPMRCNYFVHYRPDFCGKVWHLCYRRYVVHPQIVINEFDGNARWLTKSIERNKSRMGKKEKKEWKKKRNVIMAIDISKVRTLRNSNSYCLLRYFVLLRSNIIFFYTLPFFALPWQQYPL